MAKEARQLELPLEMKEEIEAHFQLETVLLNIFGDKVWDDDVVATVQRVLTFWREYAPQEPDFSITTFPAHAAQMIGVKDIEFSSICAHHLLPFYGFVHVAYVPHTVMIGLSKIPRIVDHFSHRPQTQEHLTHQIARFLKDTTEAKGVAIAIEARHTCMSARGIRKHTASMFTSDMRGIFLTAPAARQEFLNLIGRSTL